MMSDTSSSEEAAAIELGKDQGKAVMLLQHHSRNTEQKQWCVEGAHAAMYETWHMLLHPHVCTDPGCPLIPPPHCLCRDETTVLALNGLTKVLRAHMASMLATDGWEGKWDDLMGTVAAVLSGGRRAPAVAAAQMLTGVLQVRFGGGGKREALARAFCSGNPQSAARCRVGLRHPMTQKALCVLDRTSVAQ